MLPDLGLNIKCGNSLIGSDFYAQENLPALDDEARLKINAFDWHHEFKDIMAAGGFDAVIGNPPYGAEFAEQEQSFLRAHFASVANSLDSFIMFVEQAGSLLAANGQLGVIIPSGWVSTPSSKKLRVRFAELYRPGAFVSLPYDVFKGAYVDTMIVVASRLKRSTSWKNLSDHSVSLVVFPIRHKVSGTADFAAFTKQGNFRDWLDSDGAEFLVLSSDAEAALVKRLRELPRVLADYADVMRGIEIYHPRSRAECKSPKRAFAGEMLRYQLDVGPIAFDSFTPEIAASKPLRFFCGPRILLRQLLSRKFRLQAVFAEEEFLTNQSVQSIVPRGEYPVALALLGVVNSRLLSWYFCQINLVARRDDFPKTIIKQTRELPFPSFEGTTQKKLHDSLVAHVERMLNLHEQLTAAKSPDAQTYLARDIAATDRAIDQLVYQLYGLTPDESALVESTTSSAVAPPSSETGKSVPVSIAAAPPPEAYIQAESDAAHHFMAKEDPPPAR